MAKEIHSTAIISPNAEIAEDTRIGPICIIHDNVHIKKGTRLISNVIIEGTAEIGENCIIYPFTSIGLPPQDLKYKGEKTAVKIGNQNTIREYSTIHRASVSGDGVTAIGDNNFLMAYIHIAHDCKIGNPSLWRTLRPLQDMFLSGIMASVAGVSSLSSATSMSRSASRAARV